MYAQVAYYIQRMHILYVIRGIRPLEEVRREIFVAEYLMGNVPLLPLKKWYAELIPAVILF